MSRYIDIDKVELKGLAVFDENLDMLVSLSDVRNALQMTPTADVVPKSEVEALEKEVDRLKHILDCYALQYGTVMDKYIVIERAIGEIARCIFEDLEKALDKNKFKGVSCFLNDLAELKKKYTE